MTEKKNKRRGQWGEWYIRFLLWFFLPKTDYKRLNNVTLKRIEGGTTQIDHIVVSRFGIFVIETKNYRGSIVGDAESAYWQQQFKTGQCYSFQNPLRQNYLHCKTLAHVLKLPLKHFFPIVVFLGSAKLDQRFLPDNVFKRGLLHYIFKREKFGAMFSEKEVRQIVKTIKKQQVGGLFVNRRHQKFLQQKFKKTPACPQCGGQMRLRQSRAGEAFWGCVRYPACQGSRSVET